MQTLGKRLPHHPDAIGYIRKPTANDPLRILVSGCLAGKPCGADGTDYGLTSAIADLLASENIKAFDFCPEDHAIGTPRTMPDIHGGDGHDVLDGSARVLDEHGRDLTDAMVAGAHAMADFARQARVELAILTDMSAACGTQVISDGCRLVEPRGFRIGVGVAAALLLRNGVSAMSQRDFRSLNLLRQHLGIAVDNQDRPDHHQTQWYLDTFGRVSPVR